MTGRQGLNTPLAAFFAEAPAETLKAEKISRLNLQNEGAAEMVGNSAGRVKSGAAIECLGEGIIDRKARVLEAGELRLSRCHS